MQCTNCNASIDGATVCPSCGTPVQSASTEQQVQHAIPPALAKDTKGQAIASLVLGLVGLIAWIIPLFGLPVGIAGIITGVAGRKSSAKTMATIGLALSILVLVVTIINGAWGAYLGATGQHALFQ